MRVALPLACLGVLVALLTGTGVWSVAVLPLLALVVWSGAKEDAGVRPPAPEVATPPPLPPWRLGTDASVLVVDARGDVIAVGEGGALGDPSWIGRPILAVGAPSEVLEAIERVGQGAPIPMAAAQADLRLHAAKAPDGSVVVFVEDFTRVAEAERTRTEFVGNVSHELRTPLASLLGFTEAALLDREGLPPDTVEMLDAIGRAGERLRNLFDGLLRLHRIEMRRRDLPSERAPVRPILDAAVVDAANEAQTAGVQLDVECPDDLVGWVNRDALRTAVANLALNAVRYTPRGGHVVVRAQPHGDDVDVEVVDDGIGIDPAHHERVFERFYRVEEGRDRHRGGSGLGLAIVKHLAIASGWRLSLDSGPGRGSKFGLRLRPPAR